MAASPAWYYRDQHRIVGPVSAATLKRLVEQGTIGPTTSIRRGEDGPWFPAERVYDALIPVAEVEPIDVSDGEGIALAEPDVAAGSEPAEWYFSRQDRRKLGPVPRSVVVAMVSQGKLKPIDMVWKAGMASWVPAARCPEFTDAFSAATAEIGPREEKPPGPRPRGLPALAITAMAVALLASLSTAVWTWMGRGRDQAGTGRVARSVEAGPIPSPASAPGQGRPGRSIDRRVTIPTISSAMPWRPSAGVTWIRRDSCSINTSLVPRRGSKPMRPECSCARSTWPLPRSKRTPWRGVSAIRRSRTISRPGPGRWWTPRCRPRSSGGCMPGPCSRRSAGEQPPSTCSESQHGHGPGTPAGAARAPAAVRKPRDEDAEADRLPSSLLGSDDDVAPAPEERCPIREDATTIETILDSPRLSRTGPSRSMGCTRSGPG